jgi:bifunctional glutamyl/prolyl-tRNA synthetase
VPVRLKIGPKDLAQNKFLAVRRDTGAKQTFEENNAISSLKQ